jgi:hypothetical protein
MTFNSGQENASSEMVDMARRILLDREMKLIDLQKKVIELYEEIRNAQSPAQLV